MLKGLMDCSSTASTGTAPTAALPPVRSRSLHVDIPGLVLCVAVAAIAHIGFSSQFVTAALSSGVAPALAPWLLRMLGGLLRIQVGGKPMLLIALAGCGFGVLSTLQGPRC